MLRANNMPSTNRQTKNRVSKMLLSNQTLHNTNTIVLENTFEE